MSDWYVAATKPKCEVRISAGLLEASIEHYVPMERVWRRGRRYKTERTQPLLPGYVFVRTDRLDLVCGIDGVTRIVGFPDAEPMSERHVAALEAIRQAEDAGLFDKTRKGAAFRVGERVRVTQGPFMGLIAEITRFKGQRRVIVAMKAMGVWAGGPATLDIGALEAA